MHDRFVSPVDKLRVSPLRRFSYIRAVRLIRSLLLKLYAFWVLFVFTFFMILYLPGILIPFLLGDQFGGISYKFLKLWSWTFSKLNFIPYYIEGREKIVSGQSYIYVSNHTSYLDIPGVCLTVPTQIRPLAKQELKKIPVFGWIASHAAIMVDRSSNESRRRSMDHLKGILKQGISILIFPEGTQNTSNDLMLPFYDGAFRIALETQQPMLPMVILGAGKLMPPKKFFIQPGPIHIKILDPVPVAGMQTSDLPALKAKIRSIMEAEILRG